ncbi:formin-J [Hydra vulgaris]|uniref:Formin-J n=1 Tax=Hydra vulgaris TaxID=6087 RepID=A0ABM4B632_HYDVU
MSWKFSFRRKTCQPVLTNDFKKSLKYGDDKRIQLMNMVKEGKLSAEEAVNEAHTLGITTTQYENVSNENLQDKLGEIYNFGVYKYGFNNKTVKYILQLDFQENSLCLLHRGFKKRSYEFTLIKSIETVDDSTRILIQFKNGSELEIDPGSLEDKNEISHLLLSIISQAEQGTSQSNGFLTKRNSVLLEGVLEKKGHSAAFLLWTKRFVRIFPGEMMYFKVGDEDNESLALGIVPLRQGDVFLRKQDDFGFSLLSRNKEYSFRICFPKCVDTEKERDSWLIAIQEAQKLPGAEVGNQIKSVFDQEFYLKSLVNSLNVELEQLGVILNIIDAPIRASEQVKKVRDIICSLNDQIKTGLFSSTIRSVANSAPIPKNSQSSSNEYENSHHNTLTNFLPSIIPSSAKVEPLQDNFVHQQTRSEISDEEYMRILLPSKPNEVQNVSSNLPNYAKVNKAVSKHLPCESNSFNTCSSLDIPPPLPQKLYTDTLNIDRVNKPLHDINKAISDPEKISNEKISIPEKISNEKSISDSTPEKISNEKSSNEKISNEKSSNELNNKNNVFANIPSNVTLSLEETDIQNISNSNIKQLEGEQFKSTASVPPPPPPPPMFGIRASFLPLKTDIVPTCKMKPLFWSKIPEIEIASSFWKDSLDQINNIDVKKLESVFHHQNDKVEQKKDESDFAKSQSISLLDQRKAQNLSIFLSGFKLNEVDINQKLTIVEGKGSLTSEEIIGLRRFQPSAEEIEMYKSFKGDKNLLTDADKFMIKLSNIPNLATRLDILLTLRELPSEIEVIQNPIQNVMNACSCLNENKNFLRLLEFVLAYGNYMNGGTVRGRAYGFKLDVLNRLVDVRSSNKKYTLLDHIVEELWVKDRDAVTCYKDLSILTNPIDFSLKSFFAEVQLMHKELQSLNTKQKGIKEELDNTLSQYIASFVEEYSKIVENLEITCKNIIEISVSLKNKFGESSTMNFEAWLSGIGSFLKCLQVAVESHCKKLDQITINESRGENIVQQKAENIVQQKAEDIVQQKAEDIVQQKAENPITNLQKKSNLNYKPINQHTNKHSNVTSDLISKEPGENNMVACQSEIESTKVYYFELNPTTELNDDNSFLPTKSGFLIKFSGKKKRLPKWDRLFFELTDNGYLQYYKKKNGKVSGSLYIKGCRILVDSIDSSSFNIIQEDLEWKLKGDTDLDTHDWLKSLSYFSKKE